jgi:hypothetical protein
MANGFDSRKTQFIYPETLNFWIPAFAGMTVKFTFAVIVGLDPTIHDFLKHSTWKLAHRVST